MTLGSKTTCGVRLGIGMAVTPPCCWEHCIYPRPPGLLLTVPHPSLYKKQDSLATDTYTPWNLLPIATENQLFLAPAKTSDISEGCVFQQKLQNVFSSLQVEPFPFPPRPPHIPHVSPLSVPPPPPSTSSNPGSRLCRLTLFHGFSTCHHNMDNGSRSDIPAIVTEDLSSETPIIHVDAHEEFVLPNLPTSSTHSREFSDPFLLSPGFHVPGRRSFDSNTDDEGSVLVPPSPTLSARSSINFTTSTALRENTPGDGVTSLALLSPTDYPSRSHSRRPSNATMTSTEDGTVADHSPNLVHFYPPTLGLPASARSAAETLHSPTPTHVDSTSDIGDFESRTQNQQKPARKDTGLAQGTSEERGDHNETTEQADEPDLAQDSHIDPTPFKFRPVHLASLVDPKNLDALEAMGGIIGLLTGLGVHATAGLIIGGKSIKPEEAPEVVAADPITEKTEQYTYEGPAFSGTLEDRQRVYGPNILPVRKSRGLLELIWHALKDKVLVSRIPLYNSIHSYL